MSEKIELDCPVCEAQIVVDGQTGEVLWHKAKERKKGGSLEEMVSKMQTEKSELEKRFEKGIESQKDRGRLLDEKFKEAMERAEKGGPPPINPMDLD